MTAIKRMRTKEMREALNGGIAPTGLTVFGDDLLDAAEVKRVRRELEAENELFANMIAKTDQKKHKKRAAGEGLRNPPTRSLED